jgi:hypothetical protein
MNILFISYEAVSLHQGNIRSVAMIRALADAGHRIDLIAPLCTLPEHPNIRIVLGPMEGTTRRYKLRFAAFKSVCRESYDACHVVDDASFYAGYLCRWKKIKLVYDAERRFTGPVASGDSLLFKIFPTYYKRAEGSILSRADTVFSSCSVLTEDLFSLNNKAKVIQLEDIPIQPLYTPPEEDKSVLLKPFGKRPSSVIVCSIINGNAAAFRMVLMAARKVIDSVPDAAFFFKGAPLEQAHQMAKNLDIAEQCIFLSADEPDTFLSALKISDAILLVPQENCRYIHHQVYTLLSAAAPLVAVHDAAYDEILTDKTSLRVLFSTDAIAEGVLHTIQEPLFSLTVAVEGQHYIAERHTYSSFKHKVRMTYRNLLKNV